MVLPIPFAIFFGTMLGASARNYVDSYEFARTIQRSFLPESLTLLVLRVSA